MLRNLKTVYKQKYMVSKLQFSESHEKNMFVRHFKTESLISRNER